MILVGVQKSKSRFSSHFGIDGFINKRAKTEEACARSLTAVVRERDKSARNLEENKIKYLYLLIFNCYEKHPV